MFKQGSKDSSRPLAKVTFNLHTKEKIRIGANKMIEFLLEVVSEGVACPEKPPNPEQIGKYGFGSMQPVVVVVRKEFASIRYNLLSRGWLVSL